MSELNINNLPVEILIKVFRCLDAATLKNAALTCKRWNDFIVSECRWALKMTCCGYYYDSQKLSRKYSYSGNINVLLTTKRKFRTIQIEHGYLTDDAQIQEIFQSHGLNVVKLCCSSGRIDNLVAFAELLRLTPNLKHVRMSCISFCGGSDDVALGQDLPDLKKLTYLEMRNTDPQIINCFQKAKLTAIKIHITSNQWNYSEAYWYLLVQFLLSQEMLTSLTEYGFKILEELGKLHASIPFRLTHLAIMGLQRSSSKFTDLLLRFLQSQVESLKELEMGDNIPSAVYEFVFASMRKLNTLTVREHELPRDDEFYKQLKENCSVHTMVLSTLGYYVPYYWKGNPYIGDLFKKLPNVRSLTVLFSKTNKEILVMAQNLRKLESLSISFFDVNKNSSIGGVRFSNLKTLEIQHFCIKIDWDLFYDRNTLGKLVELTIGSAYSSSLTSDDMDQIATNVDLQTLQLGRLGSGFVVEDRLFKIIHEKCTNLKVLDMYKS